jgi:hypothetical protein
MNLLGKTNSNRQESLSDFCFSEISWYLLNMRFLSSAFSMYHGQIVYQHFKFYHLEFSESTTEMPNFLLQFLGAPISIMEKMKVCIAKKIERERDLIVMEVGKLVQPC